MRRYFLESVQSEERYIYYMINVVYIFYVHNVVGNDINFINVIYGGTLPVLKNEIGDFFFARLGTGRTLKCRPATTRTHTYTKKYLEMIFNQSQGI